MPFTPFHLGPAGLLQSLAPRRMSLLAVGLANVLIDLEPLVLRFVHGSPRHRFMHTLAGATVAVAVGAAILWLAGAALRSRRHRAGALWPGPGALLAGAAVGAYAHVLVDCFMHRDVHPWAPWSQANALSGTLSAAALHGWCVLAGVTALAIWTLRARPRPRQGESGPRA